MSVTSAKKAVATSSFAPPINATLSHKIDEELCKGLCETYSAFTVVAKILNMKLECCSENIANETTTRPETSPMEPFCNKLISESRYISHDALGSMI